MYYVNAQQANANGWNRDQGESSWNSNWVDQTDKDIAQQVSDDQMPGWQSIDSEDDGDHYKVHMRDEHGHFKTVMIDHQFRAMRTIDGYC